MEREATPAPSLREALEGLADRWDREDETCGCGGCGSCTRATHWTPELRALLATHQDAPSGTTPPSDEDDRWPYGTDAACRLIAAAGNPNEREENRDSWAVTMPNRPDVFAIESERARDRLSQAIAHVAAEVDCG